MGVMKHLILVFAVALLGLTCASAQKVDARLRLSLENSYNLWRNSMILKDYKAWKSSTAEARQITFYNRIVSEKKAWPATVFALPTAPPAVGGLKAVNVNKKGKENN